MAQKPKLDYSSTGLAYAVESTLGVLSTPNWIQLCPNSYSDWGGEVKNAVPEPIKSDRQREVGTPVDLDAAGGFNQNLDFFSHQDQFRSGFFAPFTESIEAPTDYTVTTNVITMASTTGFLVGSLIFSKNNVDPANNGLMTVNAVVTDTSVTVDESLATETSPADAEVRVVGFIGEAGDLDISAPGGAYPTMTSTSLDFTTLGLTPGQWIYIGGDTAIMAYTTAANNGWKRIRTIAANTLTFDKSFTTMVTEASTTETIQMFFPSYIKNEALEANRVRTSMHIERLLGAPDDSQPAEFQSEVLEGMVVNEMTWNIPTADLLNISYSYMGIDHETHDTLTNGGAGPEQTSVTQPEASAIYNTSSDFSRLRLGIHSATDEASTNLFDYVTDGTIVIGNNLETNKAVGVFGAFDITAGNFVVSGTLNAYFTKVAMVAAVKTGSNITFDMIMAKENKGLVLDIPLLQLNDGRVNVELNQPITIPVNMDAASGKSIDSNLDHTAMLCMFYYLPDAAM